MFEKHQISLTQIIFYQVQIQEGMTLFGYPITSGTLFGFIGKFEPYHENVRCTYWCRVLVRLACLY